MERLRHWIVGHKALAIGGGLALLVLLYLWLRAPGGSGANANATSGNQALAAYYGAEATSIQGAAAQQNSANALAAQTNQVQAQLQATLAEISAAKAASSETTAAQLTLAQSHDQAQLDALHEQTLLTAFHDQLTEMRNAGSPYTGPQQEVGLGIGTNQPLVWNGVQGAGSTLTNLVTGEVTYNAAGGPVQVQPGTWSLWGPTPQAPAPPLTWQDFIAGQTSSTLPITHT